MIPRFNNVLLDENDEAQCVIDLDTVMSGYVAYDFGDAVRTIINTASEDEKNLEKINLNISLFSAYTEGYLSEAMCFISHEEIASLIKGVLLLPYMQAVRFLTDYLDGDRYYKVHFEDHNLQRTHAQIRLLVKLEENEALLASVINEIREKLKIKTQSV
jgi:Ser/Thr protein kinase RdoA (MazF antagonist)